MQDSTAHAPTGIPGPTALEDTPHTTSTPTIFKQSTAMPWSTCHLARNDSYIAHGNEMAGCVVGPMPAEEFLELLPPTSLELPKSSSADKLLMDLADMKTESQMYGTFVRISFSLLYP